MSPSASRCLTYLLLLVPPLVVSFYLLASFPPPPGPLPVPSYPGLASLPPDSRARQIYSEDWVEGGEGAYVDLPMGRTRYWLAGPENGKKIVLVHGLSIPALVWSPLVPPLVAAGYRVLLYDLYGRGYSAAPVGAAYDAQLYVSQLALLMQHLGWQKTRLAGVSMGGAITAAFVSTFPALVEREVVLVASAGLVEASDLPRTAKVMSSPFIQALTANPLINAYLRHLASKTEEHHDTGGAPQEGPLRELVRLQSAHLPGFNRAVSSSLRAGPVTGMRWAFESEGWAGRKVLLLHGTSDQTVPSAHSTHIGALIESAGRNTSSHAEPTPSSTTKHKKKPKLQPTPERARVTLIPDAGHALTWTHAREVGEVVCAFLAG
ncbi:Alpha/Beta hydrolase protein [Mycena albidolilacea]|uniref:Alpha/Beta hydrolase protein n=1 Tax=Mycena albidolilacea TaxID=1033008 RepID=A0AAD7EET7_9AGAR|nr:Alpha/Beta hydrolase protein [Mycena albidolilacea]